MTVGEKIRTIRNFRKFTQAELGKKISLSDSRVRDYESGRRTPKEEKLREIAEALCASYEALAPHYDSLLVEIIETLFWLEESIGNDKIDITINDSCINRSLKEWMVKKHELIGGKITQEEYFEWKINWPNSEKI